MGGKEIYDLERINVEILPRPILFRVSERDKICLTQEKDDRKREVTS